MVSLDSPFLIDLLAGKPAAVDKGLEIDRTGEPRWICAPVAAEVLVGGYYLGGAYLERTRTLIESLPMLPFDRAAFHEAGRLGAELARNGIRLGQSDLFIAAIALRHGERLLTRDRAFGRLPGLRVDSY